VVQAIFFILALVDMEGLPHNITK